MKKKNNTKKIIPLLIVLFILGIAIGYAVLTEQLTINNTVSYDAMKWDVGFTAAEDFSGDFEEYISKQSNVPENVPELIPATVSISDDKKSVSYSCDLGSSTKFKNCSILVTVTNNSTFDVELIEYNIQSPSQELEEFINTYVSSMSPCWYTTLDELSDTSIISPGDILKAGESKQILLYVDYNELTEDILPADGINTGGTFYLNWEETEAK